MFLLSVEQSKRPLAHDDWPWSTYTLLPITKMRWLMRTPVALYSACSRSRQCALQTPSRCCSSTSASTVVAPTIAATHPHWASWQQLLAVQASKDSRATAIRLIRTTLTASDADALLRDASFSSMMWRSILRHRIPVAAYNALLRAQLKVLQQQLPPVQFTSVEQHVRSEPFLGALHVLNAVSPPADASPQALDDEILNGCTTLVRAAQVIRRAQTTLQGKLLTVSEAPTEPRVAVGPAAMRRIWQVATNDALGLRLPTGPSIELLDWVSARTMLRHRRSVPEGVKTRLTYERALAYGANGAWNRALLVAQTANHSLPSTMVEHHSNFVRCCEVQVEPAEGSAPAVHDVIRFAATWALATEAAAQHFLAHQTNTTCSDALLIIDGLTRRPDVTWSTSLQWMAMVRAPTTHFVNHTTAHVRLLFRLLEVLVKKTHYPFCSSTVCELVTAASNAELPSSASSGTSPVLHHPTSILSTGRTTLTLSIQMMDIGRWDIAVGCLTAAAHYDVAHPIWKYMRSHVGREVRMPLSLSAYVSSKNQCQLAAQCGTVNPLVYDAQVLGLALFHRRVLLQCQLIGTDGIPSSTPATTTESSDGLMPPATSIQLRSITPRTQTLISSIMFPGNPFSYLSPECFVFQNVVRTIDVFHATPKLRRSAFRQWLLTQLDTSSGVAHTCWAALVHHVDLRNPLVARRHAVPQRLHSNTSEAVLLSRIPETPLQRSEARRLLRQITTLSARRGATTIQSTSDLNGFLILVALSCVHGAHSTTGPTPNVWCEDVMQRSFAAMYAQGSVSQKLAPFVRDIGILTTLAATGAHDASAATGSAIGDAWPDDELRKFPLAACVVAYTRSLQGRWESALNLFSPSITVSSPTGVYSYDALVSALTLHIRGLDVEQQWASRWLDCALSIPNRHKSFLLAKHVQYAATASGTEHKYAQTIVSILKSIRLTNHIRGDDIVRIVHIGTDVAEGRALNAAESVALSAALCLITTKQQLLPLAARVGRPLGARELRPVACLRMLEVLPWATALSFYVDAAAERRVDEAPLISIISRFTVPTPALIEVAQFAALQGMTSAAALSKALLALRGSAADVTAAQQGVALVAHALQRKDFLHQHALGAVGMMHLAEGAVSAASLNASAFLTADISNSLRSINFTVCEQRDLSWLRQWTQLSSSPTAPITVDVVVDASPVLMTVHVALRLAQQQQFPVNASLVSRTLQLASKHGHWRESLHFFSLLRNPRPNECVAVGQALLAAPWRMSLAFYTMSPRILALRPDVKCASFRAALAVVQRAQLRTSPTSDDLEPPSPASVGRHALGILNHPPDPPARLLELADAHASLSSFLAQFTSEERDDGDATLNGGEHDASHRARKLLVALVGDFSSQHSIWRTAMSVVGMCDATQTDAQRGDDALQTALRQCLVHPIVREHAVTAARRLLESHSVLSILGPDNASQLALCASGDEDDEGEHIDD